MSSLGTGPIIQTDIAKSLSPNYCHFCKEKNGTPKIHIFLHGTQFLLNYWCKVTLCYITFAFNKVKLLLYSFNEPICGEK